MSASQRQSKPLTATKSSSSKAPGKSAAKSAAKTAAIQRERSKLQRARSKPTAPAATGKAAVLGRFKAANGKVYRVLAPATGPRHLSSDDVQQAVKLMVSAR